MYQAEHSIIPLNTSLDAPIARLFDVPLNTDPDVLAQLLDDTRSADTKRTYEKALKDFFTKMTGQPPSPDSVLEFLHLEEKQAIAIVLKYKARMMKGEGYDKPLAESTVNTRLSAIKSLVKMGRKLGVCHYNIQDVSGEKRQKYRDTSGVSVETYQRILAWCDRQTLVGQRDYALLRLLWANALRRIEVQRLNVSDFDPEERKLRILGKGRGRQTELVDLDAATTEAIANWITAQGRSMPDAPLFFALDFANRGHRLTGDAIRKIVVRYCEKAGIKKMMSPHRIRHSAITAALDATDGNLRKVQKLSRHKNIETVTVYDDNRKKDQREMTDLLGGMI
jgi:integrase/recombinase XerC